MLLSPSVAQVSKSVGFQKAFGGIWFVSFFGWVGMMANVCIYIFIYIYVNIYIYILSDMILLDLPAYPGTVANTSKYRFSSTCPTRNVMSTWQ